MSSFAAMLIVLALGLVLGATLGAFLAVVRGDRHRSGARSTPSSEPGFEELELETPPVAPEVVVADPLAEAMDRIDQGVVVLDGEGRELYRNAVAERIAAARDSRSLVESCVLRLLEEARTDGPRRESLDLFGPPSQLYVVSAYPFEHHSGVGAMAVVEDRSEAKRTETVRRDFVANISHELKTPVGAVGLLAETIRDEEDPEVMRRLAQRMVAEAERVGHTIDDLLELSRIEFADESDSASADLTEVVQEASSRIATAAEQSQVELILDVTPGLVVAGDTRQLVSALFNLLDNAVQYSSPGNTVEVTVRDDPAGGQVSLSVQDHGIGIPRRSLDRIFERFYRVDRARSRSTGGTGLGLAIVRHVVSNHHGQVQVESVEGRGSTFTVLLPRMEVLR